MALGAFAAIGQTNIKRLMAYSSIGHMGFALVGLAAGTVEGAHGVVIYMAIYLVMTLGTFAGILSMRRDGVYVEKISDLAGLARTNRADGVLPGGDDVLARRHSAARRLLRQVLCVRRGDQRRPLWRSPSSACCSARSAPTTICASSRSCISTSRPRRSTASGAGDAHRARRLSTALVIFCAFAPAPLTNAAMAAAKSLF